MLFFVGMASITSNIVITIGCFLFIVFTLPIFLDYQGVQIDLENQLVRRYKSYHMWKFGEWISLSGFDEIQLKWERYTYKTGSGFIGILGPTKGKTNDAYLVKLVDFLNDHTITIGDFASHKGAKAFLKKYAKVLDLRPNDTYAEIKERAYQRRLEVEARTERRRQSRRR